MKLKNTYKSARDILLTFDYELFLGESSGSVDACMIEPTMEIIKILDTYKLKAIFFVDTTYLLKLKEISEQYPEANNDFSKVQKQIKELVNKGHKLYLHIHPHWKDAVYHPETNKWSCVHSEYFSFFNLSESERETVFAQSYTILNEMCLTNKEHRIEGFRAGGLYIQPFEIFIPHFRKYNIKYEFSVLSGFSSKGTNYGYDFSDINEKNIYQFDGDLATPVSRGSFFEFPISVIKSNLKTKLLNSLWYRFIMNHRDTKKWGDGIPTQNKLVSKNKNPYLRITETASIEMLNHVKINMYLEYLKKNQFMHFISHPKFISRYNLVVFETFLKKIITQYDITTDIDEIIQKQKNII